MDSEITWNAISRAIIFSQVVFVQDLNLNLLRYTLIRLPQSDMIRDDFTVLFFRFYSWTHIHSIFCFKLDNRTLISFFCF